MSDDEFFSASDGEECVNGHNHQSTQVRNTLNLLESQTNNHQLPNSTHTSLFNLCLTYDKHFSSQKSWISSALSATSQPINKLTDILGKETFLRDINYLIGQETSFTKPSHLIGQEISLRNPKHLIGSEPSPIKHSFNSYLDSFGFSVLIERMNRVDKTAQSRMADFLKNIQCRSQRNAAMCELELIEMSLSVPSLEDECDCVELSEQLSTTVITICQQLKLSFPSEKLIEASSQLLNGTYGEEDEFSRLLANFVSTFATFVTFLGERILLNYTNQFSPLVVDSLGSEEFSKFIVIGVSHLFFVVNSRVSFLSKKVSLNALTCLHMDVELAYVWVSDVARFLQTLYKLLCLRINYGESDVFY